MMNLKKKAALSGAVLLLSLSMATSVFAETGTVTANVKLRSAASTESELVSGVNSGTTVEITGEENGWYKVTVNGMEGYISSEYVTKGAASDSQTSSSAESEASAAETTASSTESSVPVTVNGVEYYISQNFLETVIPSGFSSGTVTINGTGYMGAVSESMGISLVYLYNDNDEGFFVYEEASGSFKKFIKVGNDSNYIILNSLPDGFEVPSGYTSSSLSNDPSGTISAVTKDDADASDLYYVYATNNEGNSEWYLYDAQLGTYIRASQPQAEASSQTAVDASSDLIAASSDASDTSDSRIMTYTHLIAILIGAIVLLLIIIINLLLWYRRGYKEELLDLEEEGYSSYGRGRRYEDEEEEFDEEDDEEDEEDEILDEKESLPKRKSQSRPKSKAEEKPQPKKTAPKKRESKAELIEHDDDLDMDFLDLNDL